MKFELPWNKGTVTARKSPEAEQASTVQVKKKERISPGGDVWATGGVFKIETTHPKDSRHRHPRSFVLKQYPKKTFHNEDITMHFHKLADLHKHMKQDGLKVPTTMRFDVEKNGVIMTDLNTHNYIALSFNNESDLVKKGWRRGETQFDSIPNFEQIIEAIHEEAISAGLKGYGIPADAYLILVPQTPGVETDFFIADLDIVERTQLGEDTNTSELLDLNTSHAERFLFEFAQRWLTEDAVAHYSDALRTAARGARTRLKQMSEATAA